MCHLGVKKDVEVEEDIPSHFYYRLEVRVLCWDVRYKFNALFSS